jgi:hypothetical protein
MLLPYRSRTSGRSAQGQDRLLDPLRELGLGAQPQALSQLGRAGQRLLCLSRPPQPLLDLGQRAQRIDGEQPLSEVRLILSGVMRMVAIDLNGDGAVDLVASDRHADNGAGVVYLFDGATLPGDGSLEPSEAIGRWRGDAPDVGLGWQLDNVGDVDADGYEDLMFSTYVAPSGAGSVAYLVYGEPPVP